MDILFTHFVCFSVYALNALNEVLPNRYYIYNSPIRQQEICGNASACCSSEAATASRSRQQAASRVASNIIIEFVNKLSCDVIEMKRH